MLLAGCCECVVDLDAVMRSSLVDCRVLLHVVSIYFRLSCCSCSVLKITQHFPNLFQ